MRILVLDTALAEETIRRLSAEGHEVKVWIPNQATTLSEGAYNFGSGIFEHLDIEKIEAPEEQLDWPQLVVATDIAFGGEVLLFKQKYIPTIGGTNEAYDLEKDREKGLELFKKIGMPVPRSWTYDNIEKAIDKVEDLNSPVVIRFGGIDLGNLPRTNVCSDPITAIDVLYRAKDKKLEQIVVQEYKQGYEIAVGGYFNGEDFYLINVNWEFKRLFPGDVGPLVGDMGTVVTFDPAYLRKAERMIGYLKACAPELAELDYRGYFDINAIYVPEEKKYYALEFTVRPGYPTDYALQAVITNWGDFLYDIASSQVPKQQPNFSWSVGVCYAAYGYGFEGAQDSYAIVGLELEDIAEEDYYKKEHYVAIEELAYDEDTETIRNIPTLTGRILTCIGKGNSLEEALENAYEQVSEVSIYNGYYRNDIGSRVKDFLKF